MKKNTIFLAAICISIISLFTIVSCEKEGIENLSSAQLTHEDAELPSSQSRAAGLDGPGNIALTNTNISGALISGISKAACVSLGLPEIYELCDQIIVSGDSYPPGTILENAIGIALEGGAIGDPHLYVTTGSVGATPTSLFRIHIGSCTGTFIAYTRDRTGPVAVHDILGKSHIISTFKDNVLGIINNNQIVKVNILNGRVEDICPPLRSYPAKRGTSNLHRGLTYKPNSNNIIAVFQPDYYNTSSSQPYGAYVEINLTTCQYSESIPWCSPNENFVKKDVGFIYCDNGYVLASQENAEPSTISLRCFQNFGMVKNPSNKPAVQIFDFATFQYY